MPARRSWAIGLCLLCCAPLAEAQLLTALFPDGVPGYGTGQGVTVQSRARPAYDPLGLRIDTVMVRPLLYESFGYDNNIFAGPSPRGAWEIATRPSVLLGTETSRGDLGAFFSADDIRYFGVPSQNRTDGAAFFGDSLNLGRDTLTLGAGYLARHEDRTELDALPSDRPVAFSVANLRASYATTFGRISATPSIDLNRWRFDNTTILGVPVSQTPRDRTTGQLGVTWRYGWMAGRDLLLVTQVLDTHYDFPASGVASNNATSWRVLAGVDYDDDTVWRYRLLGGVEYRQAVVASETTGIAEVEVTWVPSGLTTVRATATRGVEDAAQTGLSSYTYTSARLTVDHEYQRNVLLNASATVRQATFNQSGGQQFGAALGAGATWLINRNARLSLTYDVGEVRNQHLPAGTVAGDFTRGLALLTLRLGL
jgi:hypothetical protein